MAIYKPSELREFLSKLGITPRKGLSQNFLIDGNIIRKIVKTAEVTSNDVVLEIGPGPGSLTEELINAGAKIIAVEKDPALAKALHRLKALEIHCEDILTFPVEKHFSNKQKGKVIANLPYHLTTPILTKLIPLHTLFSSIVVMVQEEVARRFTAKPKTSDYGSFTVFLNYYSEPHYAFKVSKHCFYPEPKVDSAVVVLKLRTPPTVSNEKKFFEMRRTAFEHRRKMLRASLKELYSPEAVTAALKKIGLNPKARPEELSLKEFIDLFEALRSHTRPEFTS